MKKEIRHIQIEPAENGGHTVTHHYKPMQREGKHGIQENYLEPENHAFGADEGHEMLAHVANALEISEDEGDKDEEGTGRKGPKDTEGDKDEPRETRKGARQTPGDKDEAERR